MTNRHLQDRRVVRFLRRCDLEGRPVPRERAYVASNRTIVPAQRALVLLPEDIRAQIPALGATQDERDPIAWVKLFTPDSVHAWYVLEYDGDDLLYVLATGPTAFRAYIQLSELMSHLGPHGFLVERDRYWTPLPLSVVRRRARTGEA